MRPTTTTIKQARRADDRPVQRALASVVLRRERYSMTETITYDDKDAQALLAQFEHLRTFAAAADWDRRAGAEVERIVSVIRQVDGERSRLQSEAQQAERDKTDKGLMGRLFSGRRRAKEIEQELAKYQNYHVALEALAERLQEHIDTTPNDAAERATLLKEYKAAKKELQLTKRELGVHMRAVSTEARQRSAAASDFSILGTKVVASQRRAIRRQKEAVLAPSEDAKAAIERQLIKLDRQVVWAERFE
jgi:hypothetical protein